MMRGKNPLGYCSKCFKTRSSNEHGFIVMRDVTSKFMELMKVVPDRYFCSGEHISEFYSEFRKNSVAFARFLEKTGKTPNYGFRQGLGQRLSARRRKRRRISEKIASDIMHLDDEEKVKNNLDEYDKDKVIE